MNKHDKGQPMYVKGGTLLSLFGYSITLFVRAIRTILNYIPILVSIEQDFTPKSQSHAHVANKILRLELIFLQSALGL